MEKLYRFGLWLVAVAAIAGIALILSKHVVLAAEPLSPTATAQTVRPEVLGESLPPLGCFMAHCDARLSDWAGLPVPPAGSGIIWHDPVVNEAGEPIGSGRGLGCVANGSIAVCTFGRLPLDFPNTPCEDVINTLVVYGYADYTGLPYRMWASGNILNCAAFSAVPLVMASGSVVAADNERIVRFNPDGTVLWNTPTPGGRPISLVVSDSGVIVMVTSSGPVSIYDIYTGEMLATLDLIENGGRYRTANTPPVRGNRFYIATHHSLDSASGRLYAIDMVSSDGGLPDTLEVAWYFEFGGPSGTSPYAFGSDMIYFDGDRGPNGGAFSPTIYAVRDLGSSPQLVWTKSMPGEMEASFARDQRGGIWAYTVGNPPYSHRWLYRLGMYDNNGDGIGEILEQIDLDALIGEYGVHVPSSAMTVAGTVTNPVLLVGATAYLAGGGVSSSYVVALDLVSRTLLWKVQVPDNVSSAGQFPITQGASGSRIFFTNKTNGTWVIGMP